MYISWLVWHHIEGFCISECHVPHPLYCWCGGGPRHWPGPDTGEDWVVCTDPDTVILYTDTNTIHINVHHPSSNTSRDYPGWDHCHGDCLSVSRYLVTSLTSPCETWHWWHWVWCDRSVSLPRVSGPLMVGALEWLWCEWAPASSVRAAWPGPAWPLETIGAWPEPEPGSQGGGREEWTLSRYGERQREGVSGSVCHSPPLNATSAAVTIPPLFHHLAIHSVSGDLIPISVRDPRVRLSIAVSFPDTRFREIWVRWAPSSVWGWDVIVYAACQTDILIRSESRLWSLSRKK